MKRVKKYENNIKLKLDLKITKIENWKNPSDGSPQYDSDRIIEKFFYRI